MILKNSQTFKSIGQVLFAIIQKHEGVRYDSLALNMVKDIYIVENLICGYVYPF